MGPNNDHQVAKRFKALRGTKFYDVCTAAPLIAWYAFCAWYLLPTVIEQVALVRVFLQTDPSVLPANLVLSTLAQLSTFVFLSVLVVMFTARCIPRRTSIGFWPRIVAVAGTFIGVGIVLLPQQEVSSARYLASLLLIIGGTVFAIYSAFSLGRSISMLPEARQPRNLGALRSGPPPTLSRRDCCDVWCCFAVPSSMVDGAGRTANRISASADEI